MIPFQLQCCGTTGPEFFLPGNIPGSCCPELNCLAIQPFTTGCNQALSDRIVLVTDMIGWTSVGLAMFLALTGVILGYVYKVEMKN